MSGIDSSDALFGTVVFPVFDPAAIHTHTEITSTPRRETTKNGLGHSHVRCGVMDRCCDSVCLLHQAHGSRVPRYSRRCGPYHIRGVGSIRKRSIVEPTVESGHQDCRASRADRCGSVSAKNAVRKRAVQGRFGHRPRRHTVEASMSDKETTIPPGRCLWPAARVTSVEPSAPDRIADLQLRCHVRRKMGSSCIVVHVGPPATCLSIPAKK